MMLGVLIVADCPSSLHENAMKHSPDTIPPRRDFIKTVGVTMISSGLIRCVGADVVTSEEQPPLTHLSATKLAHLIATGSVSAVDVAEAYLARIEEVNPKLNAIVQIKPKQVLAEAERADKERRRGVPLGTLHGVPFTMKDQLLTKGMITTNGCPELKDFVPEEDATVVRRLKEAGGILLGKTNVPEMCHHAITDNVVYGQTNNPYNTDHTPSGSSGGEAAIVAAGGSPVGIGTDIGGSIREPSHACGITGIKPTSRRVPETGMLGTFPPSVSHWNGVGPMARRVEDLELILDIISGPDGKDHHVPPVAPANVGAVSSKELRVAFFVDDGYSKPTDITQETVKLAADAISGEGVKVKQDRPDNFAEAQDLWLDLLIPSWAIGARYYQQEYARLANTEVSEKRLFMTEFNIRWLDHLYATGKYSPRRHLQLEVALEKYAARMLAFMNNYDVLVCPVGNKPAGPHPDPQEINDIAYDTVWDFVKQEAGAFCMAFNVTGWPAVAVRGGTAPDGMPIGVQVVAKPWREDQAIAVAAIIEKKLGGWQPPSL